MICINTLMVLLQHKGFHLNIYDSIFSKNKIKIGAETEDQVHVLFLNESVTALTLRSNPLMLALNSFILRRKNKSELECLLSKNSVVPYCRLFKQISQPRLKNKNRLICGLGNNSYSAFIKNPE